MLTNTNAFATIAVRNIEAAKKFYGETLGLKPLPTDENMSQLYSSGDATISLYQTENAGSSKATILSWDVGDRIQEEVKSLKDKGIKFEHYDMPDAKREGDIHIMGDVKAAWFKDPDGNILCVANKH